MQHYSTQYTLRGWKRSSKMATRTLHVASGRTDEANPQVFDIRAMPVQPKVKKPGQLPEDSIRKFFEDVSFFFAAVVLFLFWMFHLSGRTVSVMTPTWFLHTEFKPKISPPFSANKKNTQHLFVYANIAIHFTVEIPALGLFTVTLINISTVKYSTVSTYVRYLLVCNMDKTHRLILTD